MIKQCAKKLLKIYYSASIRQSILFCTHSSLHDDRPHTYLRCRKVGVGRRASLCLYENCQRRGTYYPHTRTSWPFPLVKVNGNTSSTTVSEAPRYEMQLGPLMCYLEFHNEKPGESDILWAYIATGKATLRGNRMETETRKIEA